MLARLGKDRYVQLSTTIGYYAMLAMTVNAAELEPNPAHEALEVRGAQSVRIVPTVSRVPSVFRRRITISPEAG